MTKIQLKRSSVLENGSAKEPLLSQTEYGELCVNYNTNDPAIFIRDSNDQIIRIAGAGSSSSGDVPSGNTPPNTGNEVGDLFFDTTTNELKYWNGSEWIVIPGSDGSYPDLGDGDGATLDTRYVKLAGGTNLQTITGTGGLEVAGGVKVSGGEANLNANNANIAYGFDGLKISGDGSSTLIFRKKDNSTSIQFNGSHGTDETSNNSYNLTNIASISRAVPTAAYGFRNLLKVETGGSVPLLIGNTTEVENNGGTAAKIYGYNVSAGLTDKAVEVVGYSSTLNPGANNNYHFNFSGGAPSFTAGSVYVGGDTSRNTFDLWKSTLTEEQLEQLEAGTLVVPANVATPGDGAFARSWYYDQQDAETQALLDSGELEYPEHLAAATFTDTFALGDNTKITLGASSGYVTAIGLTLQNSSMNSAVVLKSGSNASPFIGEVQPTDHFGSGTSYGYQFISDLKNHKTVGPTYYYGMSPTIKAGDKLYQYPLVGVNANFFGDDRPSAPSVVGYSVSPIYNTNDNGEIVGFNAGDELNANISVSDAAIYGFKSNISGTNPKNYTFYAEGSAPSLFKGLVESGGGIKVNGGEAALNANEANIAYGFDGLKISGDGSSTLTFKEKDDSTAFQFNGVHGVEQTSDNSYNLTNLASISRTVPVAAYGFRNLLRLEAGGNVPLLIGNTTEVENDGGTASKIYGYNVSTELTDKAAEVVGYSSALNPGNNSNYHFNFTGGAPSFTAGSIFVGGTTDDLGDNTKINLMSNGNAKISSAVFVGDANINADKSRIGANLLSSGLVMARRAATSNIWQGHSTDVDDFTSAIRGDGRMGLGGPIANNSVLHVSGSFTGETGKGINIRTDAVLTAGNNSGVVIGVDSRTSTTDTGSGIVQFNAVGTQVSTVTKQTGFRAENNLISELTDQETPVYGFESLLDTNADRTNTYNFYASGNAPNYFAGVLRISGDPTLVSPQFNTGSDLGGIEITTVSMNVGTRGSDKNNPPFKINRYNAANTADDPYIRFFVSGSAVGSINGDGTVGTFMLDERNIASSAELTAATAVIQNITPKRVTDVNGHERLGFVANELQAVVPEAVTGTQDATETYGTYTDTDGNVETDVAEPAVIPAGASFVAEGTRPVYQGVDQTKLIPILTKALQEALARIEALENA